MKLAVWSALALALGLAGAVVAQTVTVRTLPEDARRGYLTHVRENLMTLDGVETKLAPGAQIRGPNNLLVLPASLPRDSLVKYQLDKDGALYRAWILTSEEAARPDKYAPVQGLPIEQVLPRYTPPPQPRPGDPPSAPPSAPQPQTGSVN